MMPTRKKALPKNSSRGHSNPQTCRVEKKINMVSEKKVSEMITSAKKTKSVGITSKQNTFAKTERTTCLDNCVSQNENQSSRSFSVKDLSHDTTANCMSEIIFSPAFHHHKDNAAGIPDKVSAMYLAMQNSKLECMDEQSQDSMSTDGSVEPDENDEFDDFDPYVFIRDLPDLSVVVPKFRPFLLPKQTRSCPSTTLVLDLDETLVHSTLELCEDADFTFPVNFNLKEHTIYVRCRPYLKDFLEKVASMFETIIFTASQSIYAEQLLNVIDPKRRLFRHRVYRESCVFVEGNYLKDLSVLGRDLAHVIILDNSPQAFGFQLDNGIPIESWFDNRDDRELLSLLPFLESLVGVDDVRPLIAKKFNLREKVASAAANCFSIHFKR
ncbi:CTD small phosphatase-like protein 2 isoform X9 [Zingiber officinale]|uniref:CTD small phosphatase-like protein 2 isoform X9 n=1 Tax=Zingiber officinale TaxID=94328 RepID=UPI001C4AB680|nr:CTD small phosphatase-like protein 2 isoform X9 [Zingiber officinale]